jgi:DNA repair exonuclease SbcCD nuclease subunit
VRILFLSDTHLGIDLPSRPRVERPRRGDDFFHCYQAALAPALAGQVDAVLHGGDLLYRSRVPAWLAEAALAPLRRLAAAGVPVLLLPGNHERARVPFPLLAIHPDLHLFDQPRCVLLEARGLRVAFAGFPYESRVRDRLGALVAATGHAAQAADVRVLCLHQCIEGATCGPGDFTFRGGEDVIRSADLPRGFAAVLSGHIHRHQVLRHGSGPTVVYAGSVERTSFAEAGETKGAVLLELSAAGIARLDFQPLPARPMHVRALRVAGLGAAELRARLAALLASLPSRAVVQLRLDGAPAPGAAAVLSAAGLRELSGDRSVALALPRGRAWRGRRGEPPRPHADLPPQRFPPPSA